MDHMVSLADWSTPFFINYKRDNIAFIHDWRIKSMDTALNCILVLIFELRSQLNSLAVIEPVLIAFTFLIDLVQKPTILQHLTIEYFSVIGPQRADTICKVGDKKWSNFMRPFILPISWEWLEKLLQDIFAYFLVGLSRVEPFLIDQWTGVYGVNLFYLVGGRVRTLLRIAHFNVYYYILWFLWKLVGPNQFLNNILPF